jgi:error-prone DNA polymerase
VDRIVAARPYHSLTDFWQRAQVSRPVLERLVLAGGFDSVYGIGSTLAGLGVRRRGKVTRRDLLLQVADLDRHARAVDRAGKGRGRGLAGRGAPPGGRVAAAERAADAAGRNSSDGQERAQERDRHPSREGRVGEQPWDQRSVHPTKAQAGIWEQAARQSRATRPATPVTSVQLALDLGDAPVDGEVSGLPEMNDSERVRAELEILGLDASRHVVEFYDPFLDALGVTRSADLLRRRSKSELLVAGVKVATQTPPIRSGRRVVFLTLDDSTGPVDATFFEDVQGPYAATVFHSWLLVVRGELRRTGRHGVSLRATGCWELPTLHDAWQQGGLDAVHALMARVPEGFGAAGAESAVQGAAESRSTRPVVAKPPADQDAAGGTAGGTAGGMGRRRVLVHSSGFAMSPYADIKPAGEDTKTASRKAPRKLWHSSPGSSGG